jgi:L,D-transpeptidase YbiS
LVEKIINVVLRGIMVVVFVCCVGCSSESSVLGAYDWQLYVGSGTGIWVSIEKQELMLIDNHQIVKRYRCSTAAAGVGNVVNSGKTPLGWHRVGAKVGGDLSAGAVLKDREWTGEIWTDPQYPDKDLILSRILRLEGLEEGKNCGGDVDTWSRYIYIHGTNQIGDLGRPASAGCVRLDPTEVIDLYERLDEGCCVLITED